ncbi:MAG: hypothetical protein PHF67_03660 [Candidatus Nanoarchaeia archaeon]|nr:hypothetical protein [Candidatus Nanoarchaeia archaeon]
MIDHKPHIGGADISGNAPILPTNLEITTQLLRTLRHAINFHYYAYQLGRIGQNDPELPHDLAGPGNRLEWEVVSGLALQFRTVNTAYFNQFLQPLIDKSVQIHRQQNHHRMWNGRVSHPAASKSDLEVGALDTICALLEPREYNGGAHDYGQILEIVGQFSELKAGFCKRLIEKMTSLTPPDLDSIQNLVNFPNIGLDSRDYIRIQDRMKKAIPELNKLGYSLI